MERRLTTILSADVVGYSRMMAADEAGTLASLKALRSEIIEPQRTRYRGRVVKLMGDGILMEFASVVDAVSFAIEVQRGTAEEVSDVTEHRRIIQRIGINLGDVIIDGDDLYGDGVNIAARIEALAEPGGVCISGTVFDHIKGKVSVPFTYQGEHHVKNIPEPLRIYRAELKPTGATAHSPVLPTIDTATSDGNRIGIDLSLPEAPSIAVLPFDNMSTDPEQEFFSDGITEDIITTLSKIGGLLVIARNSSFVYKGMAVDVKQISREQGVRYVLEGSVRKGGRRVRVTAQLIDATTGHHIWAERYDRDLEDVFAIQDEITREVVLALDVRLNGGDQMRIWSGGTKNVEAWECVRLGMEAVNALTPEGRVEAGRLLSRAPQLDAEYPMAWASLGWFHWHRADFATALASKEEREVALASAIECARKALELDGSCADGYAVMSLCYLTRREYERAIGSAEKAVELAPSLSENLATSAVVLSKSGQPERALHLIKRAMRLCPMYPAWYLYVLATACRLLGRNADAIEALQHAVQRNPDGLASHVGLASILGEEGSIDESRVPVCNILRIAPHFSIAKYVSELSYRNSADSTRFEKGLRRVGLPK